MNPFLVSPPGPRRPRASVILLSCLLAAPAVLAQSTVVVTGSREPLSPLRLAADVAVIDAEAIHSGSADSLADLLRREAGVQISRNGGPGHASGLLLRGTGSSQSIVLVDGVRVGSATLGFASLESVPLAQVARVEVLRGPGSSLYGADAVGGVVNVVTRRGEPGVQHDARLAVGGYGSREASVGLGGAQGAWDAAVSLATERSRGVSALRPGDRFGNFNPDRDGHRLDAFVASAGFKPAPGHRIGLSLQRSRLDSQYDGSEFQPPVYAQDATPDFRIRQDLSVTALDWRGDLEAGVVASARVSRSVDDAVDGATVPDRFRTTRDRVSAQLSGPAGVWGRWVLAGESGTDRARSSSFAADVQRRSRALVAELTGNAGPWAWQADLRRDDASGTRAVDTGRLGGSFAATPGFRLRLLAGSTFRAPTFNDLYFPGYGVADLRPERGRSVELGASWRQAEGELAATLYRNRVRDLIGYQADPAGCPPDPAYAFGCAGNTADAQLTGATLSAQRRMGPLALKAQLDLLRARDGATGERLPRRASRQASVGLDWARGELTYGMRLLHVGSRPDGGKTLAAESTLDLLATWRLARGWSLQAKLVNVTDTDLEPARDYQGLGRQAWLTLRLDWR